jgi:hypothetical protein
MSQLWLVGVGLGFNHGLKVQGNAFSIDFFSAIVTLVKQAMNWTLILIFALFASS